MAEQRRVRPETDYHHSSPTDDPNWWDPPKEEGRTTPWIKGLSTRDTAKYRERRARRRRLFDVRAAANGTLRRPFARTRTPDPAAPRLDGFSFALLVRPTPNEHSGRRYGL